MTKKPFKLRGIYFLVCMFSAIFSYSQQGVKIAVLSDPHLHNIYLNGAHKELEAFYNPNSSQTELIRSLKAQMQSTRLFNENYFSFKQALEDLAKQDIKFVIISGDYTDDGQYLNLLATKELLSDFEKKHNMRFFLTNGNHEAVNMVDRDSGKKDFLNQNSDVVGVFSSEELLTGPFDVVYKGIMEMGYESMYPIVKDFGLEPKESDLFYSTPFESLDYSSYDYKTSSLSIEQRKYTIDNVSYFDFSYLVEPVKGLWILSIDGNMYEKVAQNKYKNISDSYSYINQREYLLNWITQVVAQSKKLGKRLIAFGHYPILDFNNNQTKALQDLLGQDKFQTHRVSSEQTQNTFLKTGLPIHFAGHMHVNQQGFINNQNDTLWNIQVPSLAAFPPAYKIVEVKESTLAISTKELVEVQGFDSLFKNYYKEQGSENYQDFLDSENYYQLTKNHLKHLSHGRFYTTDFGDLKWDIYKNAPSLSSFISPLVKEKLNSSSIEILQELDFKQVVFDLYLIRNANDIGIRELGQQKVNLYKQWSGALQSQRDLTPLDQLVCIISNLIQNSISTEFIEIM